MVAVAVAAASVSTGRQLQQKHRRRSGCTDDRRTAKRRASSLLLSWIVWLMVIVVVGGGGLTTSILCWIQGNRTVSDEPSSSDIASTSTTNGTTRSPGTTATTTKTIKTTTTTHDENQNNNHFEDNKHETLVPAAAAAAVCPVLSISDLSDDILNPTKGSRWVVTPPQGGDLYLMCCQSTKVPFSILLHSAWAPIGVPHLLDMLSQGYWSHEIPLFRCTDACQFGLSSNTTWTKRFDDSIPDDPLWLPTGPEHRLIDGLARYPKGVLTHAGGGPNTRSNQFVLTLKSNKFMGGGSPWEVPLGEVVGRKSDTVLDNLYNGYGEKGPSQSLLRNRGVTKDVKEQWPLMDYIQMCEVVDSRVASQQQQQQQQPIGKRY
ncbi:hypothetical protein IV203_011678 [Nitzschia inconspicua]|uniref:PPIase cyclophilin-type domain-containing protein n=1 Tax=Nitzschia inconspicua TaxID=303405 RepID=A0A9K3KT79_9STRA|nr:hypothetical protein IV203_011678 [Nitzschia inconspicua]